VAAEYQPKRVDIVAPQNGIVHQLAVHTVGGVVAPGEPTMMIVPDIDKLVVEAKVAPQGTDQVYSGQKANLRFSAFSQKTTPEILGAVERMSADVSVDQRTGASFYVARMAITPAEIQRLGTVSLMPGMPVETSLPPANEALLPISSSR
jgi:HlyD family secretion protein